jgi:uncharacterized membrane protein YdjX (TVP38/TMEM64 family)
VAALLFLAAVVGVLLLPVPSPLEMRDWAQAVGVAAPALFLLGHTVVTVAPFPRTVFTLAAGLLFGPVLGSALSLTATTLSAVLAFLVVRWGGRRLVLPYLRRGMLRSVDARLRHRGWLAMFSLRLIPPVPFSVINYCGAVSSIPFRHYLAAMVGVVPGSVAVVVLGDALTGTTSPTLLAVTLVCTAIGVAGLVAESRLPTPEPETASAAPSAADRTSTAPLSSPPR